MKKGEIQRNVNTVIIVITKGNGNTEAFQKHRAGAMAVNEVSKQDM